MISVVFFGSQFLGRYASGTAQVTERLIRHLILSYSKEVKVVILFKSLEEKSLIDRNPLYKKCEKIVLPQVRHRFLNSSRQFYRFIRNYSGKQFDILHFMTPRLYPFYWKFPAKRVVCTFHAGGDITIKPEKFILSRVIFNFIAMLQWKKLSAIYAVSDLGAKEISFNYKIPIDRISKIFIGADSYWNTKSVPVSNFNKSKINIVIVGRWQTYKNIHSVLLSLIKSNKFNLSDMQIYLIGKSEQLGRNKVRQILEQFPKKVIVAYDYISIGELKYLYNFADLVIHPSINEGFGLPAFEAFGEGATLLVHDQTPAAAYLQKNYGVLAGNLIQINEIADLIMLGEKLKRSPKKLRRDKLKRYGMTWSDMAQNYYHSYIKLLDY